MTFGRIGASRTLRRLPYDAEVEWLESTGTQWIVTDTPGESGMTLGVDFLLTNINRTNGSLIFGIYDNATTEFIPVWKDGGRFTIAYGYGTYVNIQSPFQVNVKNSVVAYFDVGVQRVELNGKVFRFVRFESLAGYLTGGWFEEYVYKQMLPLQDKGLIHDLRINFEVSFKNKGEGSSHGAKSSLDPYQEMDIVFTDGSRLYLIECKAGNVTIDHVVKLQNVTRNFGGVGGRGILASCFPLRATQRKRLSDARECRSVCGENIAAQIEAIVLEDRSMYLAVQHSSSQASTADGEYV